MNKFFLYSSAIVVFVVGLYFINKTPSCRSGAKQVKQTILENIASEGITGVAIVLVNIQEIGYDEDSDTRKCKALLMSAENSKSATHVIYEVSPKPLFDDKARFTTIK